MRQTMIQRISGGIKRSIGKITENESRYLLLLSIPFAVLVIMFSYVPLLGWSMAFVKYIPGRSIFDSDFVGLHYFKMIFSFGSEFPRVLRNTFALSFLRILASPVPVILALIINEIKSVRLRKVVQTATSIPHFLSFVVIYSLFNSFLSSSGVINVGLMDLGVIEKPINVLANPDITWFFQTCVALWKNAGWSAIIYIAAIASIDPLLYEAARVDGANKWQQMRYITVPGIMPTYIVLLILSIGHMLNGQSFQQIFVFHNPLVHQTIETLDYYTYRIGMKMYDFSLSTAIGMFKSVVSVALLFSVNWIGKKFAGKNVV